MQQMRTQIGSDPHDDIGFTLTSIFFYSETVKMQLREDDAALKNTWSGDSTLWLFFVDLPYKDYVSSLH